MNKPSLLAVKLLKTLENVDDRASRVNFLIHSIHSRRKCFPFIFRQFLRGTRAFYQNMSIGVPIKVLHEAEGHVVTLETLTGEVYRGKLVEAEDNMNCQMANITCTSRDGRVSQLEQVYIRGSKIRFLILPDMLKNAPMFKKMTQKSTGAGGMGAAGRGKSAILRAQAAARGRGGRGGRGGNVFQRRR